MLGSHSIVKQNFTIWTRRKIRFEKKPKPKKFIGFKKKTHQKKKPMFFLKNRPIKKPLFFFFKFSSEKKNIGFKPNGFFSIPAGCFNIKKYPKMLRKKLNMFFNFSKLQKNATVQILVNNLKYIFAILLHFVFIVLTFIFILFLPFFLPSERGNREVSIVFGTDFFGIIVKKYTI